MDRTLPRQIQGRLGVLQSRAGRGHIGFTDQRFPAALQALEPRNGANLSAATAAKAGVAALSAALGEELAGEGILVNAVAPSIMDTPTNRRAMPKANFDTWPKVEEVAATILFLASPENKVSRSGVVPVFGAASQTAAS